MIASFGTCHRVVPKVKGHWVRGGRDSQLIRMLIFSQDLIHRDVDVTKVMCLENAAEIISPSVSVSTHL